jgi:hypothetical protein
MQNPGWNWLASAAQHDVDSILQGLVTTPREEIGIDKVLSWVFQLGEIAGIKKHFDKPQLALATAEEAVAQLMEEERLEDERRDTGDGIRDPGDLAP